MKKFTLIAMLLLTVQAFSKTLVDMKDPKGDDKGPGTYVYPTDPVYKKGSFDLLEFKVKKSGSKLIFTVKYPVEITDPWNSKSWGGNGFSLQFVQVYIDTTPNKGHCKGLPGLNVNFKKGQCWDKVILISPQGKARLKSEINQKAKDLAPDIVIPLKTMARGKKLIAVVKIKDLGGKPEIPGWGFQVVSQSNEGYPDSHDLLTRKVNEYPGKHRFGGGSDYNCDPHVLDIFVPPAKGTKEEIKKQYEVLKYHCDKKGHGKLVELPMVYPGAK